MIASVETEVFRGTRQCHFPTPFSIYNNECKVGERYQESAYQYKSDLSMKTAHHGTTKDSFVEIVAPKVIRPKRVRSHDFFFV